MTDPDRSDGRRSMRVTGSPPSVSILTGRETPVTVLDAPVTVGTDSAVATPAAMTVLEPVALLDSPVTVLGGAAVGTRPPGRSALVYRHLVGRPGDDPDGTPSHRSEDDSTGPSTADERVTRQSSPRPPTGQDPPTGGSPAVSGSDGPGVPANDTGSTGGGGVPVAGHRPTSLILSTTDSRSDTGARRRTDTGQAGPPPDPTPALRYRPQTTRGSSPDRSTGDAGTDAGGSSPDRTAGDPGTDADIDTTTAGSDTGTARLPDTRTGGAGRSESPVTDNSGSAGTSTEPGDTGTRRDRTTATGQRTRDRSAGSARGERVEAAAPGGLERTGRTRVERLVERRHAGDGPDAGGAPAPVGTGVDTLTRASTVDPGGGAGETGSDVTADWPALVVPTPATDSPGTRETDAVGRDGSGPPTDAGLTHPSTGAPDAGDTGEPLPADRSRDTPPRTPDAAGTDRTTGLLDTATPGETAVPDERPRVPPSRTDAVPSRATGGHRERPSFTHLSPGAPAGDGRTPGGRVDRERTGDRHDDPGATGAAPVVLARVDTTTVSDAGPPLPGDRNATGGAGGASYRSQTVEGDRNRPSFTHLSPAGERATGSGGGTPAADRFGGSPDTAVSSEPDEHGGVGSRSGGVDRDSTRSPAFTHLLPPGGGESNRPGAESSAGRRETRAATGSAAATSAGRAVGTPPPGPVDLVPRPVPGASNRTATASGHDGVGTAMTVLSGSGEPSKDLNNEGTQNGATDERTMPSLTLQSTGDGSADRQRGERPVAEPGDRTPAEAPGQRRQAAETGGGGRTDHARRVERSLAPDSGQAERNEGRNGPEPDSAVGSDLTVRTLAPRIDATRRGDGPRDITHTDRRGAGPAAEPLDAESLFRAASSGERAPADIDQVVERLYRRIERRMRIERERRGL
jgi:serine/arginine repetitive matrix protein 2